MNTAQRYNGAIALIKTQTNYTEEEAKIKLEEHDGNYMNVIKEYLNPNFRNKKTNTKKKSVNEKMMYEIRNFMDTAANDFKKRKAEEEQKQKYLKAVYDKFLAVKAEYPNCIYNPPNVLSCDTNCPNPMCPGELREDKTYSKMA
tara:strand:- start:2523 stop:2954 length:432 start_codon:yes stop_codon:yes gene_type:complete